MAAGFSVTEAVRAATQTGADLLALEDIGMLKPDKEATFVVVKGAPDQLPGSLHHIAGVYIKGRPLNVGFQPNLPIRFIIS